MKNILFISLATLLLGACNTSAPLDRSIRPSAAPAKENTFGEYEEFKLDNGLTVYVIENSKLPTISYNLSFDIDPIFEGDKAGYTSMVGDLLEAGTKNRNKENLNKEVDFIGANMGVYSGGAYTSGLSKYNEKLMDILSDVVLNPVFPEDELNKTIKENITSLKSSSTNADAIMGDVKSAMLYGKGHPYGEFLTEATLGNIKLEDCKNYYNSYFKPNNALLTIVGDITKSEAEALVKKYFGSWEKGTVPTHSYEAPIEPTKPQVYLVHKEGAVQSNIDINNLAKIKIGDADYEAAQVFNQIFGSGFAGRLFQNLREDKEYTYGAYGGIRANKLIGNFSSSAKVRNEVTDSAIDQFLLEINRIRNENVGAEELQNAKNYIAGTFAQSLESSRTVARFAANIAKYNLDKDYYKNYLKRVELVTMEDIKRVATSYLKPANINIVVVGEANQVGEKLKRFGELHYVDREGNEVGPPAQAIEVPKGTTVESIFESYYKALGGKDKIKSVKTMKGEYSMSMMGRNVTITNYFEAPNKTSSIMDVEGMGVMQQKIYDGSTTFLKAQGQTIPVSENESIETRIGSYLIPELFYAENGVKTELAGAKIVNGKSTYVVNVTYPSGKKLTSFYDMKTGLKVKETSKNKTPRGEMESVQEFKDYKAVNGILIPHTLGGVDGGMPMDVKLDKVEMNIAIPAGTFKL